MISEPYISVIIVSWNALETIQRCLPSVANTDHDSFEIVFVDNASQDESVSWVKEHFPAIRIVNHPENWAFCKGNNRAVPFARGEVLVFLNNDVEVPTNWLSPIIDCFQNDQTVAAAQPKLHQFVDRDQFEYAGAAGGFLDKNGYPFTRGRIFETLEKDSGQYDDDVELFWASGTCLVIRKNLFLDTGGFEESFFMHMEEIDLCWRLKRAGHRIVLIPKSIVFHMGGASLSSQSSQKHYLNFRNNLLMLYRNLPPSEWRVVLARRIVLDSLAILRALLAGQFKAGFAIIRAYVSAFRMKATHENIRPLKSQPVAPLPYRGSIIWDYFIAGRKRFSDLDQGLFKPSDRR